MDSLGHSGEDDVFLSGTTPISSLPLGDQFSSNVSNSNIISSTDYAPSIHNSFQQSSHRFPYQPSQQFWAPSSNSSFINSPSPHPSRFTPANFSIDVRTRWVSPTPPPTGINAAIHPVGCFSSNDAVQQQQHRENYRPHQQLSPGFSSIGREMLQSNPSSLADSQSSQQAEQWESIYTPFGPVRSRGNFTSVGQQHESWYSLENAANPISRFMNTTGRQHSQHHVGHHSSISEFELQKRSASVSSLSHVGLASVNSSISDTTAPGITAAGSPVLLPKGRSYRDVAKSKAEKKTSSTLDSGGTEIETDSRKSEYQNSTRTSSNQPSSRKHSMAGHSCSDSASEFGGSESGTSPMEQQQQQRKHVGMEEIISGHLGKNDDQKNQKETSKTSSDRNVLKKSVATGTSGGSSSGRSDFQRIMRRKASQSKSSNPQTIRDPSPTLAAASRYAVLGKKSSSIGISSSTHNQSSESNTTTGKERQNQRVKLNNEDTSPRFNSKSPTRKAAYINNDLSWPGRIKSTNRWNENEENEDEEDGEEDDAKEPRELGQSDDDEWNGDDAGERGDNEKRKGEIGESSGVRNRRKGQSAGGGMAQTIKTGVKRGKTKRGESGDLANKRRRQQSAVVRWINFILAAVACYIRDGAMWLVDLVMDIGNQLWEITVYFTKQCLAKISLNAQWAWYSTGEQLKKVILCIRQKEWSILLWWRSKRKKRGGNDDGLGLEENIDLPNTGEDALKRLLMCRGQDAYSILGLRPDCTDDEVKYYYRRQAILVHPDKNACYGADEAFKILAAAFELIGTPERRGTYDLQNLHRTKAMQELQEMLAKLKSKVEEIRSTMQCDCGGKHKRFATDRELAYARYCRKCSERHHAREGDIWAESHWFGFLWYYYACMDGVIYDITEWAGCQKNNLKHMKPDTHLVQYRLITGRNARQFHQQQHSSNPSASSNNQQYPNSQQQSSNRGGQTAADAGRNSSVSDDVMNFYWDERFGSSSKNAFPSTAASSIYLPAMSAGPSSSTANFSGFDFSVPAQSKFNPPSCSSHGDSRPRKAARRKKPRV